MSQTGYIVFEKNGHDDYRKIGIAQAATPKAAISGLLDEIAKKSEDPINGTFAAVPVRNWSEFPVGVEVQTRIKVG